LLHTNLTMEIHSDTHCVSGSRIFAGMILSATASVSGSTLILILWLGLRGTTFFESDDIVDCVVDDRCIERSRDRSRC